MIQGADPEDGNTGVQNSSVWESSHAKGSGGDAVEGDPETGHAEGSSGNRAGPEVAHDGYDAQPVAWKAAGDVEALDVAWTVAQQPQDQAKQAMAWKPEAEVLQAGQIPRTLQRRQVAERALQNPQQT